MEETFFNAQAWDIIFHYLGNTATYTRKGPKLKTFSINVEFVLILKENVIISLQTTVLIYLSLIVP